MPNAGVLTLQDVDRADVERLLARFGLAFSLVEPDRDIPGSYWGDSEAGVVGTTVFARPDTPVHSLLHETAHVVCMDPERRQLLHTDAGGDDLEESAVCYLQVLLSDHLPGVGRERLIDDMDCWGYSFRLGSTGRWFARDADDARDWLLGHDLVTAADEPRFRLRR